MQPGPDFGLAEKFGQSTQIARVSSEPGGRLRECQARRHHADSGRQDDHNGDRPWRQIAEYRRHEFQLGRSPDLLSARPHAREHAVPLHEMVPEDGDDMQGYDGIEHVGRVQVQGFPHQRQLLVERHDAGPMEEPEPG